MASKNMWILAVAFVLTFSIAACGGGQPGQTDEVDGDSELDGDATESDNVDDDADTNTGTDPGQVWKDEDTGLTWQVSGARGLLYKEAVQYCSNLKGKWRMPDIDELLSTVTCQKLVDECKIGEEENQVDGETYINAGHCGGCYNDDQPNTDLSCLTEALSSFAKNSNGDDVSYHSSTQYLMASKIGYLNAMLSHKGCAVGQGCSSCTPEQMPEADPNLLAVRCVTGP